ncbi:MAG: VCBS repeat-containing protein [Planctomycetota bacterium]
MDSVTGAVHSLQPMECSPIDLNGDDRFEATCNGGGFSDVALVDADGNDVWVFDGGGYEKRGGAANDLAVGDIDGDGDLEFCIGFSESLGCFDERGEEIWRENDKSFGYNQVLIINGTSSLVLAVRYPYLSRDDYSLIVRTGSGELLFNRTVSRGFHFDLAQWPPDQTEPSLVTATDSSFAFRNLEGELKLEYAIPDALVADEDVDSFACEYVVLEMDSQKYLLVNYTAEYVQLAFSPSPVRSAILLYDTSGNLVYFEVLDDLVTIVSLADTQTGVKKILMLKRGTIFEILAPSQPPPVIMAP